VKLKKAGGENWFVAFTKDISQADELQGKVHIELEDQQLNSLKIFWKDLKYP
jgi:hypothetical protein